MRFRSFSSILAFAVVLLSVACGRGGFKPFDPKDFENQANAPSAPSDIEIPADFSTGPDVQDFPHDTPTPGANANPTVRPGANPQAHPGSVPSGTTEVNPTFQPNDTPATPNSTPEPSGPETMPQDLPVPSAPQMPLPERQTPAPQAQPPAPPHVPAPAPAVPAPAPAVPAPAQPVPRGQPTGRAQERGPGPRFSFTRQLEEKFKDRLNKGRPLSDLSARDQTKWIKIFDEIRRVADIRNAVPAQILFISNKLATELSEKFEKEGSISQVGAWTIALEGTARRHGFENAPCAEFMSELIRQAYARAGYDPTEDFSQAKGNALIYTFTASVTGLGAALLRSGWSVWDASRFRPPMGAILVHTIGQSPSHTYMAAGLDGSLIVDNSAPRGRDLRQSSDKVLRLAYQTGAFYLPPGQIPPAW